MLCYSKLDAENEVELLDPREVEIAFGDGCMYITAHRSLDEAPWGGELRLSTRISLHAVDLQPEIAALLCDRAFKVQPMKESERRKLLMSRNISRETRARSGDQAPES